MSSLVGAFSFRLRQARRGGLDLVGAFHGLEHIRDVEALPRELNRLAAPGAM